MDINTTEFSATALALGERRLLAAILRRAVLDYLGESKDLSKEAETWIFHPQTAAERDNIPRDYSFHWICMQLGLDTAPFLRKLLEAHLDRNGSQFRASMESAFV